MKSNSMEEEIIFDVAVYMAVAGIQGSTKFEAHPISIVAPAIRNGMQECLSSLRRGILILTRNGEIMDPKTKIFQSSKGSYMVIKVQRLPHPAKSRRL